jgi:hypothetical protein
LGPPFLSASAQKEKGRDERGLFEESGDTDQRE